MSTNKTNQDIFARLFEIKPRKSDLKKIEILQGAMECIYKDGLENTTIYSIAKSLEMTNSHVVYYFRTMDELLLTITRYIVAIGQDITIKLLRKATTPREQIQAISDGAFEWLKSNKSFPCLSLFASHNAARDSEYRKLHTQIKQAGRDRLTTLIMSASKVPELSRDRAEILADQVQNIVHGNLIQYFASDSPYGFEKTKQHTVDSIFKLLEGII